MFEFILAILALMEFLRFIIIGEIFDKVYQEGALGGTVNRNDQTTLVPSAGATIVEFKLDAPGTYTLVDHNLSSSQRSDWTVGG